MTPHGFHFARHDDRLPWPTAVASILGLSASLWVCLGLMSRWLLG